MVKKNNLFVTLVIFGALLQPNLSHAITSAQADSAYNAFYNHYWNSTNNTFYKYDNRTGLLDFWRYAHCWETMMDIYDRTHNEHFTRDTMYLRQMKQAWTGFNNTNGMGTDWKQNDYNDDIAWWILAAGRAYLLTRDTAYCNAAKRNFDWMYSTQCDATLGGGIWWKNTTHGEKNACINGPAICGAMYLYWIYNDTGYLGKAKAIYKWERATLFNAGTGAVADHISSNGTVSGGPLTYNQGTFIGAAYRLFKATRDSSYLRDAWKAADYTRSNMCVTSGGVIRNGGLTGDGSAFLIVFVHHMMYFIIDGKQSQYLSWMTLNAETAWRNRRQSDNIMSSAWNNVPPTNGVESSSCAGGVAIVNLVVLAQNPVSVVPRQRAVAPVLPAEYWGPVYRYALNGRVLPGTRTGAAGIQAVITQKSAAEKKLSWRAKK